MFNQNTYNSILKSAFALTLFLTLFLFEGCSSNARQKSFTKVKTEPINAPKLVLQDNSYDFGKIRPNSINKAIFNFTNVGDQTLVIKEIKKCCGAVIKLDKEELAPGESGVLTAEYHAASGTGALRRKIGLITNEPNSTEISLVITGEIIQTLTWEPRKFEIATYGRNSVCPEVKIKSLDGTQFSIKNFASSGNCLSAEFDPNFINTEIILKPEVVLDKINELSSKEGKVNIELNHPDYKTISFNFNIISSLEATPSQIIIFNAQKNQPFIRSFEVHDFHNQNDVDISGQIDSISSERGAKVELINTSMVENNYKLNLKITPALNEMDESFSKDQVVIKMKDGRTLNVPIFVYYIPQTLTSKAN
jgi:hypothetical protein